MQTVHSKVFFQDVGSKFADTSPIIVFNVVLFFVFAFYDAFKYKWLGKWILEQRERIKEKDKRKIYFIFYPSSEYV